jgi:hypothetical protein
MIWGLSRIFPTSTRNTSARYHIQPPQHPPRHRFGTPATSEAENEQDVPLETLAAVLMSLSANDRAALAKMLIAGQLSGS